MATNNQGSLNQLSEPIKIDYRNWDWLPGAAFEMQTYIARLLAEAGIHAHDVTARAKSISSFQRKQRAKKYTNPGSQVTDTVAIRVITYSTTDRARACELIRERFEVLDNEDRNPGDEKPANLRGYDCQHIVVSGENPEVESGWVVSGGSLQRYFKAVSGLEIQIRTVAGHAWAEFEHSHRYKGTQYEAVSSEDQATIDQLFGAAADARRALDEIFVSIDRLLARPTAAEEQGISASDPAIDELSGALKALPLTHSNLDTESLTKFLEARFPDDGPASPKGIDFALELAQSYDVRSVEELADTLRAVDSEDVRTLMDTAVPVTRVRRFDDELLARFREDHITRTGNIGNVKTRTQQLEWRFDRLRGKTRYKAYSFDGADCPSDLRSDLFTASSSVREVARIVASMKGTTAVLIKDAVSATNDLPARTRPREVKVSETESIWVATNLNRDYAEGLIVEILKENSDIDIQVHMGGSAISGFSG